MITINPQLDNELEWTVYKGLSKCVEDFTRSKLVLFAVSLTNKIPLIIESADDGCVKTTIPAGFEIPTGLTEQTYDTELIWIKNGRDVNRTYQYNVFKVDIESGLDKQTIKIKSTAYVYGYDGLSSYELARLLGKTKLSLDEWVETASEANEDILDLYENKANKNGSSLEDFEANKIITNAIKNPSDSNSDGVKVPIAQTNNEYMLTTSDGKTFGCLIRYDSVEKKILLCNNEGQTISLIDATDFIKDGMVDNVEIKNGNLVITFNTEAGKENIEIPLTDIFNPNEYYKATIVDEKLAEKVDLIQHQSLVAQVTAILEFLENKENKFFVVNCNISSENVVTTDVTYDELNTAFTQGKHCVLKLSSTYHSIFFISDLIKSGNVFTARGFYNNKHFIVSIYKNSNNETIITYDIKEIQDKLVSGINIASINNQSLLNGGNINVQAVINALNKLSADFVDDTNATHKFVTSAQTETWDTVTEKAPLPFVVTVSINPESDVTSISHTISEIDAAYRANKQLRLKCTNAQQGVWFEEDLTRISQGGGSYFYVSHTVTDEGVHYIITIYDDNGTTKAKFEMVDDKAYAKYYDVLINTITPTIASSTVTIDGYTIYPSEETFVVKPYQKITFSDTNGDCYLYIIDATNPSTKTVISYKSHLIVWDNQSDTDVTIQVGIDNGGVPGTLGVNTYWRGTDNVFVAEYNVTSASEIESAVDSGRVVMCRAIEDDNIVYYQLSQSSSTSFTFFRFVNARYYRIVLYKSTGEWYTSDDLLQSTSNRDSSIDSSASITHYPSTKAVYDYVQEQIGNINSILETI